MFKDSEEKEEGEEVAIKSYAHETPISETIWENINDILADGYVVDGVIITAFKKKPSATGDTDRPTSI